MKNIHKVICLLMFAPLAQRSKQSKSTKYENGITGRNGALNPLRRVSTFVASPEPCSSVFQSAFMGTVAAKGHKFPSNLTVLLH